MAGLLVDALGSAAKRAEAFSDTNTLRHMLRFEAALAQATAEAGLIPKRAAAVIAAACDPTL
jgi:3-carboxy-cis,cis-muconate cycloisomerase